MAEARVKYTSDTRQVETGAKRVKGTFDRLKSSALSVGKAIAAAFVVRAVARFGVAVFRAAASFDAMKRGLKAVIPAGEDLEKTLSRIKDLAKEPGLGFREALEGVTRLRAVGVSAAAAEAILKEFGNSVALVGGGKAELLQAVDAISKMGAEGKITEERLNQLALNMPTLRRVMQETFGTGTAEGIRALGLSVDDFTAKLVGGMSEQQRASGGAANAVENLGDAYDQLKIKIGETFAPAATKAIENMTAAMENLGQTATSAGDAMDKTLKATAFAVPGLGPLQKLGKALGESLSGPTDFNFGISDQDVKDFRRKGTKLGGSREDAIFANAFGADPSSNPGFEGPMPADPLNFGPNVVSGDGALPGLANSMAKLFSLVDGTVGLSDAAGVPGFQAGASSSLASIGGGGGVGAAPITRRLDNQIKATKAVETAVKEINLDLTLR